MNATAFFALALLFVAASAGPVVAPQPAVAVPKTSARQFCIQVVACCRLNGRVVQTGTPCACADAGGTVIGFDTSQCPAVPEPPAVTPAPEPTSNPDCDGFCIQVVACCREANGSVGFASTPCACRCRGGTVLNNNQCS